MSLILEDDVAVVTFKKNAFGTVDIAGQIPDDMNQPGDIIHDIFVALKPLIAEVVLVANQFTQQELEAEGHDVQKIMEEVRTPDAPVLVESNPKIITDLH